ncbi:MAG TPA: serine hydrolase domain-containing protein [Candidatus Dormibacteraeota bacterium]
MSISASARLDVQAELDRLTGAEGIERVPGVAIGVLEDGVVEVWTSGVASPAHSSSVTPETLFRIASISKLYTATLVMQLVDEGKVDLDRPLREQLPGFRLADQAATAAVTVRHLLCHTSGIPGDFGFDGGRGDDAVARYVAALADLPPVFAPGLLHSYSNAGFVVLGRLVEYVTGATWDEAIQERIARPLGLENTVTLPEDVLLRRHAVGHATDAKAGTVTPIKRWTANRASGPCGIISSSVVDLLAFGRWHLESPRPAMFEPQVTLPQPSHADAWGLGFELQWSGDRLVASHGGNVAGQTSTLLLIPDRKAAVAVLTSSDFGRLRTREVMQRLLAERFDVRLPGEAPKAPAGTPDIDFDRYVGAYERVDQRLDIARADDGGLQITLTATRAYPPGGQLDEPLTLPLRAVREDVFLLRSPGAPVDAPVVFTEQADGRTYLRVGLRSTPRS